MSNAWTDAQQKRDEWPVRHVTGKDLPATDAWPHHRVVVTAGLHQLGGNARPYWSVTAEIIDKHRRGDDAIEACGCLHDEIREHFPQLAPVVDLHLSDDQGVPLHAAENARYWLGLTNFHEWDRPGKGREAMPVIDVLARHLRITDDDARALSERFPMGSPYSPEVFAAEIDAHRDRWQAESDAARALLESLT